MENRGPFLLAVVAAMLAAALPAYRAVPPAPDVGAPVPAPPAAAGHEEISPPLPSFACRKIPAPLVPICRVFSPPGSRWKPWQTAQWAVNARGQVRFLIALVGDPIMTGDRLRVDRTVEGIQNAAGASGYQFDRFFLPWSAASGADADQQDDAGPPTEPGLLLFRPIRPGLSHLAVLLVGESPVRGINREAFGAAIRYAAALSPEGPMYQVDVAGPNFSGSFASLGLAIDGVGVANRYRVVSPSTTGAPPRRFTPDDISNVAPTIGFQSIVHSDGVSRRYFESFLRERWDSGGPDVVVLSETNTVFGRPAGPSEGSPPPSRGRQTIQFPREIARLRIAHPEATPANVFSRGVEPPAGDARLPVPLREPQVGRDAVPTFAPRHRPVAQEAMLLDIVATLRQQRTRVVQIVATDILDSIFLSGFLRQAYPEARILVGNSDVLVVRAADRLPLTGTLALTTFPIFLYSQVWADPPAAASNVLWPMGSRFEYGLFNAVRALLFDPAVEKSGGPIDSRFPEFGYRERPPLWLTVVGTNGYWPIALLDRDGTREPDPWQLAWPAVGRDRNSGPIDVGRPTTSWLAIFWGLTVAGLVLAALVGFALVVPEMIGAGLPAMLLPGRDAGASCILVGCCLSVAALTFAHASPMWWLAATGHAPAWPIAGTVLSVGSVAASTATGLLIFLSLLTRRRAAAASAGSPRGYFLLAFAFVLGFAASVALWAAALWSGHRLEPLFFAYRSLDPLNGVCPVAPFIFLGLGLVLFAVLHGLRHTAFLEMAPGLPRLDGGDAARRLKNRVAVVRDVMGHPLLSRRPEAWLLSLPGALTLPFLWPLVGAPPQSLENRVYDFLYGGTLLMLYGFVVLAWGRFLFAWYNLHAVLDAIERHPVRFALRRLPRGYSALPLLQGPGTYSLPSLLRRSLEILRALANLPGGGDTAPFGSDAVRARLKLRLQQLEKNMEDYEALGGRGEAAAPLMLLGVHGCLRTTGNLIANELERLWRSGARAALDESGDGAEEGAKAGGPDSSGGKPTTPGLPEAVALGQEFIAVQYVLFAGSVMRQLRAMLLYLTVGFFLGVVSALVYPFRSQEQVVWVATANFIILGVPVATAIVQMERDDTLHRLTDPGAKHGTGTMLLRLAGYGALPLLGLATSHVPAIGRYLVSILEPALRALP